MQHKMQHEKLKTDVNTSVQTVDKDGVEALLQHHLLFRSVVSIF